MEQSNELPTQPRRNFLTAAAAVLTGTVSAFVPLFSGILFFLDPIRRKSQAAGGFIKVTSLDSIPDDGTPVRFPITMDRRDAWNVFKNEPVGAVYLRKIEKQVIAFNVICPHLGCSVDYKSDQKLFHCPCHNSSFDVSGERKNTTPPRSLDTLEVDPAKLDQGEVWVKFQNFRTGEHDKIAKA